MSNRNSTDIVGEQYEDPKISLAVEKCIERITRKKGLVDYKVNISNILTNGENYFATLQAVNVKGRTKYSDMEINLFVKNRVLNTNVTAVPFIEIYKREAFFYNELVPIYNKLQDEVKIPDTERFKVTKSYEESNSDVTILEDLTKRGFRTFDRREPMSLQFAELSVKQLAKFHALSFVLQDREPEYFNEVIKSLKPLIIPDSDWETLVDNISDVAVECLDGDSKYRLEKYKPRLNENYKEFIKFTQTSASCLCHGDFRHKNVMIIEKNDGIKDLVVIDFQLVYYGSPVMDLIYFIFVGTDQTLRTNHLEALKELYYETFKHFLKYFDLNAEHVYPKERFEQEYRDNLGYGFYSFMLFVPFSFCDDNNVPNFENGMSRINVNINNDAFKERLRGVVADLIQWGHL